MISGGKRNTFAFAALLVVLLAASCSAKTTEQSTGGTGPPGSAGGASTSTAAPTTAVAADGRTVNIMTPPVHESAQHLSFSYGPIKIEPGQNNITFSQGSVPKPEVDGYIVAIKPNLKRNDGSVPPVDVIHLHHGVWVNLSAKDPTDPRLPERIFASGEEKTYGYLPSGYGYAYHATDKWLINYMLHNLLSSTDEVSITYDIDFVPADSPAAKNIKPVRPIWMDIQNGSTYPVFDVIKDAGANGLYTYPDDATDPYRGGPNKAEWTVDRDGVMVATAGHMHPGGLHTDLFVRRAGATASGDAVESATGNTAHVFRSEAVYFEPAGAVSWDVAMTATPVSWKVAVKKGDVLRTSVTYDSARASWYESMGIMVMWMADGTDGVDPFAHKVDAPGEITHGHLAENDNHGGGTDPTFADLTTLPNGATDGTVTIADFAYAPGDMAGLYSEVPTVKKGSPLRFVNAEARATDAGLWHTITACKSPCNRATGVAYPLADADITFDSGELGFGGQPTADRDDWSIPTDLPSGTYTYFCRIHPSMRGGFRIED